jgi:hypothetical protein
MKIRNGFVSNSSSSSFVAVGASMDISDLLELLSDEAKLILKELMVNYDDELDLDDGDQFMDCIRDNCDEFMEDLLKKLNIDLSYSYDYEQHCIFIGKSPFSIGDDETGKQFKDNIEASLLKLLKTVELEDIENITYG